MKFLYAFQLTEAADWGIITSQASLYSHFELLYSEMYVSQIRKKKELQYEIGDHNCIYPSIFLQLNFLQHLAQRPYVCMIRSKWSFTIKVKYKFNRLNSGCLKVIIISGFSNWFWTSLNLIHYCIILFQEWTIRGKIHLKT